MLSYKTVTMTKQNNNFYLGNDLLIRSSIPHGIADAAIQTKLTV